MLLGYIFFILLTSATALNNSKTCTTGDVSINSTSIFDMIKIEPLIPELQKYAIEELGEVPERIPEDLQALKEWMKQQLYYVPYDNEQYLIQSLRGTKYNVAKAKKKIDFWLSFPRKYLVEDVQDPKFRQFVRTGSMLTLPLPLNGCGPRIILLRFNFQAEDYNECELFRYFTAMHHVLATDDPYACIHGCIYIFDLNALNMAQMMIFSIKFLATIFVPAIKEAPFRIRGGLVLNISNFTEHLAKFTLSLLTEKFRKKIFIHHKGSEFTNEVVPQKYLPLEYGGENGSLEQLVVEQANLYDKHHESVRLFFQCHGNDKLRQSDASNDSDVLAGTCGTFKKLNVD